MNGPFPAVARLEREFGQRHRLFRDVVKRAHAQFGDPWAAELDDVVTRLFDDEHVLGLAVDGYSAFALDAMRLQNRFDRERSYPQKTFAEAAADVYLNETYMNRQYLPGLLLSHYLWGHHYRQLRYFRDAFVAPMALAPARFAEIGVGTGVYSRTVLAQIPSVHGAGFDISPSSKAFAEAHLARFGVLDRYGIEIRDALADPPRDPLQWLVCVEVLEHLDDPLRFLRGLRGLLAPAGKAFVTAALNAANADHIYLYRDAAEVATQLRGAGFAIEQYFVGNAYPPAFADQPVPAVAAFVVTAQEPR
jgi:2-polyprenyl-3-methyl-5-hydroxy-6-metoxy-1,4-benzoquinol methylase